MAFTMESTYHMNKDHEKSLPLVPLPDPYPLSRCIEVLNGVPGSDPKLYANAMNLCMHSHSREVIFQVPMELMSHD
uniref:Uncharacterized protein n=1 Tax=Nelumbo nucifera TaxID=4432 RepID=A0A822Z8A2_NELNU|nr:TPA_asm: hypothetical protein HUJ06_015154 [Nelumbo nucifera]